MKLTRFFSRMVVAILLLSVFTPFNLIAEAQMPGPGESGKHGKKPTEIRDRLVTLKIWKLTEELKLDDTLAAKLFPRIREFEEFRHQNMEETQSKIVALKELVAQGADDSTYSKAVSDFMAFKQTSLEQMIRQHGEILDLLTPEQQVRYLIIDEDLPRELKRFLNEQSRGRRGTRHKNTSDTGRDPGAQNTSR